MRYFDTSCFSLPLPGTFGNSARNLWHGPGINNWDMSFFKIFRLPGEGRQVQFRFESLEVWQRAAALSLKLFEFADELEQRRRYKFAEQFRSALQNLFDPHTIEIRAGNLRYRIGVSALDRRRTKVSVEGPRRQGP